MKRVGLTLTKTLVLTLQHCFTFDARLSRCSTNKAVTWQDKQLPEGKKKGKPVCVFLVSRRSHFVNRCTSPRCQSPLYSKQTALSGAGIQLPLTSTFPHFQTFSPHDRNSSHVVQSQKGILAVTPHVLPRGLQVWEEFSLQLIRGSCSLFLPPLDFSVLTASINLSPALQVLLRAQHITRRYLIPSNF